MFERNRYAALAGVTRDPDFWAAGVDLVGPTHLKSLLESVPPYWAPLKRKLDVKVGTVADSEWLDSISPLTYVNKIQAPLLVGQGANDPRVRISESDQLVDKMVRTFYFFLII